MTSELEPPTSAKNTHSKGSSITRIQSLAVLSASIMAAVSTFFATVIAQRVLPATDVTEFLLFWSLLFGVYGVIGGIASEATRAVGAAQNSNGMNRGARPTTVALVVGVLAAIIIGVTSPLWISNMITQNLGNVLLAVLIATVLYSVQSAMVGTSSGLQNWYMLAAINGGEALWRLISMITIGIIAGSLWGMELAVVSPVLLWVVLILMVPSARIAFGARGDVDFYKLFKNIMVAMASAASSAVLTVGFPLVMNLAEKTAPGSHEDMMLGALVLAISITRSPIIMPVQAFQGVSIAYFMKNSHRPIFAMIKPVGYLLGLGVLGGIGAYLLGPFLFLEIYEPKPEQVVAYEQVAQGGVLGLLTFVSAVMGILVISATAVLAVNMHRVYIAGWVVAALVSSLLLFLPIDLIYRVIIALFAGPASGFLVHMCGLLAKRN